MGFTVKRGSEKGSRRGSEKAISRRCLERPLEEYAPFGVCPIKATLCNLHTIVCNCGLFGPFEVELSPPKSPQSQAMVDNCGQVP